MMAGGVLFSTLHVVDMFFVGKLGPSAIASVGMGGSVMFLLGTLFMGLATGTTALISRAFGAGERDNANHFAMQSLTLALFGSAVLSAVGYFCSPALLRFLGAEGIVLEEGIAYLRINFLGAYFMYSVFVIGSILNGAGDAVTPFLVMSLASLVNIFLDYVLIFGHYGFPALGVRGSALATVLARVLACLAGLGLLFGGVLRIHPTFRGFYLDFYTMWRIIRIGVFSSVQMLLRSTMNLIFIKIVALFGMPAVAAYTIGLRLRGIGLLPGFGMANAAATMVGQNLGARKPDRSERSALAAVGFACAIMTTVALAFMAFAPSLVAIFTDDPEVMRSGVRFLRVSSIGLITASIGIVLGRSLNGAGDTLSPMIITFIGLWCIQIPLAWLLSQTLKMGEMGIWYAWVFASLIQAVMCAMWFGAGKWKTKKI